MQPTSPAGSTEPSTAGYVLIELIAALALLGLIMAMTLPTVPPGTTPTRFRALLSSAATLLRETRTDAIMHGADRLLMFDRTARVLRGGSRRIEIPADVDIALLAGASCPMGPNAASIVFRGDGTSCGAVLRLARDRMTSRVRVNWATGHVEIVDGG